MEMVFLSVISLSIVLALWVWGYQSGRSKGYGRITSLTTNPFLLSEIPHRDTVGRHELRQEKTGNVRSAERDSRTQQEQLALIGRLDARIAENKKKRTQR